MAKRDDVYTSDSLIAGEWIPVDQRLPKHGQEVPVLYYPTRRTRKGQLRLAEWDPHVDAPGPGWTDMNRGEFYPATKVLFWMNVEIPERPS